jgi:rRNA-processing protein FCF1
MNEYLDELLLRYQSKGVLIDTNLLLLYCVGRYDKKLIRQFKRTMQYAVEDYDLLVRVTAFFAKAVTTPNILTEVNSLSNQLQENIKKEYATAFTKTIEVLEEFYSPSRDLATTAHFSRFGLADSSIVDLVKNQYLVLTDDLRLADYMQRQKIDVVNFTNLRYMNL